MVYYDHNRVVAIGGREIGDEVDRELLKEEGGRGGDGHKWRDGRMGVDLVLLTKGTAVNEVFHEGGETQPPEISFKDSLSMEDTHVTHGGGERSEPMGEYTFVFKSKGIHCHKFNQM